MPASPYEQLEQEFRRLHAFRGALSLLRWDAAVMMPRGSADVRGEQLAALETEHHALLTTPKVARLLERAEAGASQLDDWPLANLHEMRRQRDHAIATPPSLIARLAKAAARAEVYWVEAKKANDFKLFAPHLEEVVHLVRDKAALLGQARGLAPYDALVDGFTPGISTADIDTIFKALSRKLPSLISEAIEVQAAHPPNSAPSPWMCSRLWVFPSIAAGWTKASIPSPRACRGTFASPHGSTWAILSRGCSARCMRQGTPCTILACRSSGAINRWAAIADWRWRRVNRCCSR
jgi:hypothetical protein